MSGSLNRVILLGNLASDPEMRYTGSGKAQTRFRLAVGHRFKDTTGQIQEDTTFVTITVWGPQAESCAQYLSKGRSALVEGRLRISSYSDDESKETRWFTEVVASNVQFVGGPPRSSSDEPGTVTAPSPAPATSDGAQPSEEEVPF
jgi:single-strand DNA-binding protein